MDPQDVIDRATAAGARFCDVRIEETQSERLSWRDQTLEDAACSSSRGYAVRVLVGDGWGFASGNDLTRDKWQASVDRALAVARRLPGTEPVVLADAPVLKDEVHWRPKISALDVDIDEKKALLSDIEGALRLQKQIATVDASLSATQIQKEYADSDGTHLRWSLPRIVAQTRFTAKEDGVLDSGSMRVGATKGWEAFSDEDPVAKAKKAAETTVAGMSAPAAKGGKQTVVIDHELAGVFAHEAVGHAAEADLVQAGESCFAGRIDDKLGIDGLTIRDDATWRGAFGAYPFDDNGVAASDRVLVEDGYLRGYLLDREHAGALGMKPNGAARAQDYQSTPLVRMSTTLIDAGDYPEDEVFEGIKDGIFCKGSRGGQVDTSRGTYLFNSSEAYRIIDGEIASPVRDVSLTGQVLETLHQIEALGNKQKLGDPGHCGKGQWVPVCDGGPLVRIANCLVGGSA